ncbi:MAG: hypothetical protein HPY58_13290 [Firmicutes bacterium]|nr:hypothetical protein [Bacillota bacterium]
MLLDLAKVLGFLPAVCRPYRAETKGKVESGIKYSRDLYVEFVLDGARGVLVLADPKVHLSQVTGRASRAQTGGGSLGSRKLRT